MNVLQPVALTGLLSIVLQPGDRYGQNQMERQNMFTDLEVPRQRLHHPVFGLARVPLR